MEKTEQTEELKEVMEMASQMSRSELVPIMQFLELAIVAERAHISKAQKLIDELRSGKAVTQESFCEKLSRIKAVIESEGYSIEEEINKMLESNSGNGVPRKLHSRIW